MSYVIVDYERHIYKASGSAAGLGEGRRFRTIQKPLKAFRMVRLDLSGELCIISQSSRI